MGERASKLALPSINSIATHPPKLQKCSVCVRLRTKMLRQSTQLFYENWRSLALACVDFGASHLVATCSYTIAPNEISIKPANCAIGRTGLSGKASELLGEKGWANRRI